jgi:chromosome segregation ATPase
MKSLRKKGQHMHDPERYRDERLAVLETVIGHINTNLEKIDKRFDSIDQRFEKIDQRFEKMEQRFEKIDQRFEKMDQKFEQKFDKIDYDMRQGFAKVNDRLWSNFLWLIGLILATSGGLFTLMAHGFHWF